MYCYYLFGPLIKNRKIFVFYEAEDLVYCGVTFMLALALANNIFKNNFTSLKDIYSLVIPPDTTAFVSSGITNGLNSLSSEILSTLRIGSVSLRPRLYSIQNTDTTSSGSAECVGMRRGSSSMTYGELQGRG